MNLTPLSVLFPRPENLLRGFGSLLLLLALNTVAAPDEPMQGVPPSRDSQVTFQNYRESPFSQWAFRNAGAPMHVVMVPREGAIHQFGQGNIPNWNSATYDRCSSTKTRSRRRPR